MGKRDEDVFARSIESADLGQFGEPPSGAITDQHSDDVDGLGDERARYGHHAFLNELFEPPQRAERRACVDCADPAWMTRSPGLEQIERFSAAHLTDGNAIGSQTQRRADQIGQSCNAILGPQRDEIGRGTLQFARVLDQDNPVGTR